ncbi:hypothetical protein EJ06DRAFT_505940 [Trichodelitschia bisporula]|uniref:RNA polymerase III transcription factor IIIC subunit n=1 Tax=Trichodelitschia bisporula TaxID=703511 RepID=A0A6G1I447_9PEZI|nr:hypothetical protein EJ06DRAFT_505940 [Trichodelitschia bisporula]
MTMAQVNGLHDGQLPSGAASLRLAPFHAVRKEEFVHIEHPCIIKDLDKGLRSLGGEVSINKFLESEDPTKSIAVSLRPEDALATSIPSDPVTAQDLLLKITVPKVIRRRRKGIRTRSHSDSGEFVRNAAVDFRRTLRDNPHKVTVTPVGVVKDSHRFRTLPDYQHETAGDNVVGKLRDTIMKHDKNAVRTFRLNPAKVLPLDQTVCPPPFLNQVKVPHNYAYRQNPYVRFVTDSSGAMTSINVSSSARQVRHNVAADIAEVPTAPPVDLPPEESLGPFKLQLLKALRAEFDKRPIMSKRVYMRALKGKYEGETRKLIGYVGYSFDSGPFRDSIVRFGLDPRSDPKYREFQTIFFQLSDELPQKSAYRNPHGRGIRRVIKPVGFVPNSHLFDGKTLYQDARVWQMCDVTDPLLRELLKNAKLRDEFDPVFSGWYENATWTLLKIIMRHKIKVLAEGETPDDGLYKRIIGCFPDAIDPSNVKATHPQNMDTLSTHLCSMVRAIAMSAWRQRERRYVDHASTLQGDSMTDDIVDSVETELDADARAEIGFDMDSDDEERKDELDDDDDDEAEEDEEDEVDEDADDGEDDGDSQDDSDQEIAE